MKGCKIYKLDVEKDMKPGEWRKVPRNTSGKATTQNKESLMFLKCRAKG